MLMKRLAFALCLCAVFAMGCGGSGGPLYTINTNSGKSYVSSTTPDFDEKAKTYTFEDMDGNQITINQDEVAEIKKHNKQ